MFGCAYSEALDRAKHANRKVAVRRVDAAVGLEVREAMMALLEDVWHTVAYDCLQNMPKRTMTREHVIEVVLDQADFQMGGLRKTALLREAYDWWKTLTLQEQEAIAYETFTDEWYGM